MAATDAWTHTLTIKWWRRKNECDFFLKKEEYNHLWWWSMVTDGTCSIEVCTADAKNNHNDYWKSFDMHTFQLSLDCYNYSSTAWNVLVQLKEQHLEILFFLIMWLEKVILLFVSTDLTCSQQLKSYTNRRTARTMINLTRVWLIQHMVDIISSYMFISYPIIAFVQLFS